MGDLFLPQLMVGNCSDHICVRVSRFWDFYNPRDEKKLLHTNMVLIDEKGNSIHAQIYPPNDEKFREVEEGGVYIFYYFQVKNCSNNYKPVANDQMLSFSKWTKIEKVVEIPSAFPMYAYSLASMEQLQERIDSSKLFSDVIGVITAISTVGATRTKARPGESLRRSITIQVPSGGLLDVVLWSERASSFPAEEIHKNGQSSPQIVIFVGTLVKSFGGMSLSGGSSCKWYINPEVPEAKELMARAKAVHSPIAWAETKGVSSALKEVAEEKKISDIKNLNPFECEKTEFLVTVTVKKIDGKSWWYNACKKCSHTAKRHGNSFKCINSQCGSIGMAAPRYKLAIQAGDETGDANFILFGRTAQQITKRAVDTLIADNPVDFIPDEITKLLEKTFTWNVSFTNSSVNSDEATFQVNVVVAEIDDGSVVFPAGSQTSSMMLSAGVGTSMLSSPQKSHTIIVSSLPAASEASLASSATPAKAICAAEQRQTPQSVNNNASDERNNLASTGDALGYSATKTQKNTTKKRSRPSPDKKVAKKLFPAEAARDGDGDSDAGADATDQISPIKDA
ncbi:unnamed protein product [Urochloa humidicola]